MTLISLGDMAQTFMMRRLTASIKQDARLAAQELTTGRSADVSKRLQGGLADLTGVEATLSRLKSYRMASDSAALTADSMQTVFRAIDSVTEGIGVSLLAVSTHENIRTLGALVADTAQRLDAVMNALNTKMGDTTLFAGIASDGPAMASSDVILTALEAAITADGAVTVAQIETSTKAWFQSPTGFAAVAYLGAAGATALAVSAEDRVDLGITAADPALRDTLQSLALVALVARGTVIADPATGAALVQSAGLLLLQNHSDRATLAGRLGLAQARIDQAQTRNTAEASALQILRSNMVAVDPYEAATRMEAAQNQLETLYSVTARLSRLSLVDFLR